ncbi:MAG TPA: response regulator transcription factor [Solirubrobacteraceae bacterium]|nr:response regulator transcription factor [Solirubrobacteraceae bacterium]
MSEADIQTTVLIVDDDPGFRRVAAEMLAARGYEVVGEATTADEALQQCGRLRPDAVLLDVGLPDGNGVTLAETLRAARDGLNILLTSTDCNAVAPERLRHSAASGFVPKPQLARTNLEAFLKR